MRMLNTIAAAGFGLIGMLALTGAAAAQDNLEQGKNGAQLFATDCAMCHKSAQALPEAGGLFGMRGFLAQHYTASADAAARVAAYLETVRRSAPRSTAKHRAKRHATKEAGK